MSAILQRMMAPGFKLLRELIKGHGPKKGVQLFKERIMQSTPSYARKSVGKELLNPKAYKRYKKTADKKNNIDSEWFQSELAGSHRAIRNLQDQKKTVLSLKRTLSRNLNRRPKQDRVIYKEEIEALRKKINSLNTRIGHHKNMRKNTERDLDVFNQKPLNYKEYINSVKNTIDNTPINVHYNPINRIMKPKEFSGWAGRYTPGNRGLGKIDLKPEELGLEMSGRNIFHKYGNTAAHELKHAVQFNLRKKGAKYAQHYDRHDKWATKHFKKNWKEDLKKDPWYGYQVTDVPIELSARATELRTLPAEMLKDIIANPKSYQFIDEVEDIARFTGYGKNFSKYLKGVWGLAPVAVGPQLMNE